MKKQTLLLAFCLMLSTAHAQHVTDGQLFQHFDQMLSEQFKPDEPGAAVLVARQGKVIYSKAFGMANMELNVPMENDHVFWIASLGKQFTAIAILQLMEQGKLGLQDDITRYIPDYPTRGNTITIEHLLTHSSGIHNFSGMEDPEKKLALDCTPREVIDFFKNLPMRFTPGTQWEYSNSGYFLLGYIIEVITGQPYSAYIEDHILRPAGMTHSLYASDTRIIPNRVGAYSYGDMGYENAQARNITHVYSAGAIQSTVADFFKWHLAVHQHQLVKKETLERALTRVTLTNGKEADYGYGWRLGYMYDSPSIWHGGLISGFGTTALYLPVEDVFVVVFTNCDCQYPKDIASRLAALAAGKPYTYEPISIDSSHLYAYTGVYENEKGQQRIISVSGNTLLSQSGRGPSFILIAYQPDQFFFKDDPMQTFSFSLNGQGEVDRLTTRKLTGNEIWKKTTKPIPDPNGIHVDEKILASYIGEYEIPSQMKFTITLEKDSLFVQAPGQDKIEIFGDTETKFFAKVNDAQFEFIRDDTGQITKVILNQSGRTIEAMKVK